MNIYVNIASKRHQIPSWRPGGHTSCFRHLLKWLLFLSSKEYFQAQIQHIYIYVYIHIICYILMIRLHNMYIHTPITSIHAWCNPNLFVQNGPYILSLAPLDPSVCLCVCNRVLVHAPIYFMQTLLLIQCVHVPDALLYCCMWFNSLALSLSFKQQKAQDCPDIFCGSCCLRLVQ